MKKQIRTSSLRSPRAVFCAPVGGWSDGRLSQSGTVEWRTDAA